MLQAQEGRGGGKISPLCRGLSRRSECVQVCPNVKDREIFQCGPDAMMRFVLEELEGMGISSAKVHQEAFSF